MKKVYAAPQVEYLNYSIREDIAEGEELLNGKSFPYNDGQLGWT